MTSKFNGHIIPLKWFTSLSTFKTRKTYMLSNSYINLVNNKMETINHKKTSIYSPFNQPGTPYLCNFTICLDCKGKNKIFLYCSDTERNWNIIPQQRIFFPLTTPFACELKSQIVQIYILTFPLKTFLTKAHKIVIKIRH